VSTAGGISGVVETQPGQPVSNATVEIWATSDSLTVPDGSSLRQEQNKLLDQATDPIPDRFEQDQQFGEIADREQGIQPLVHTPADWEEGADTSQFAVQRHRGAEGLDVPRHTPEPGEEHVISCWDLTEEPSSLLASEDSVDSKWMGQTTDCTVKIRKLGPGGDVVDGGERTVESEVLYTTENYFGTVKKHHGVRWTPQQGIYEITTSKSNVKTYVAAGGIDSIERTFAQELRNQANENGERAKFLKQQLDDKTFDKIAVETNATGHWSADVPEGYSYVAVTARKGTYQGNLLMAGTSPENRTMQAFTDEWSNAAQTEVSEMQQSDDPAVPPEVGSVYLSTQPERVDVPSNETVVRVREISTPTYTNGSVAGNFSEMFSAWLNNQSQEEIQQFLAAHGLNTTETEAMADRLNESMKRNEQLREEIEDQEADINSAEERLQFLQKLIMQQGSTAAPENTEQSVGETTDSGDRPVEVVLTYPSERFGDSLATGNWTVLAHDSTGDERVVPDEQVDVDRNRGSGTVDITVSDTMPADVASTRYEVIGISEQDVTRGSATVENPDAAGSVPALESIDISSTRPGPADRVTMNLHPTEDSSFATVSSATVYHPDGSTSQADVSGSEIAFTTNGSGTYAVDVVAENTKGTPYHETIRVHAGSADVDMPPGVRMRDTQFGTVALATDGAQEADVSISDDRSEATIGVGLAEGTDLSDGIHVYSTGALSGDEQTIRVRALDESGRQLGQSVGVTIHHDDLSQDALIYRNDDPITGDAKVVHGSNASAATSIQTVTTSDGTVEIDVNRDPSLVDRASYRVQSALATIDLPSPGQITSPPAPSAPMPALGGLGALALAGGLARRNRGGRR
jgi:predicted RecB family endonuclease